MSSELARREAEYDSARRARDGARRRVAAARAEIPALMERERLLHQQAREAQELHDLQQARASAAFAKNRQEKVQQKVRRRDYYGRVAGEARQERDRVREEIAAINARAESLARLIGLYQLNHDFVVARHHWLMRLAAEASPDMVATKNEYARQAGVPSSFLNDPGDVLMYSVPQPNGGTEVHLFYGGAKAPTGEGTSPDGLGHAHHVLEIAPHGTPTLSYARYLDGSEYRQECAS